MIALGIDPGTARCGFGVVSLEDGNLRLIDAGVVRTDGDATDGERLRSLHAALAQLLILHRPHRVGIERLFFQRNVQAAMTGGQWRGIARLVAAGETNKSIAASLHISENTVEHHLSSIFDRLGVRSRSQLAARVAGHDGGNPGYRP